MLCVCVRGIRGEKRDHQIDIKRNTQEEGVYFTSRIRITKCSIIRSHNYQWARFQLEPNRTAKSWLNGLSV